MFDLLPNLLSSIITILFPIFASYKALRTSDPAQLTPWLMYWVVLSCFSLIESWTWFILAWLPFYAYLRLLLLSYLVLPQTQGARLLYQTHIHPFLSTHEHDIDDFITSAHDRAKAAGLSYIKRFVDFVRESCLGMPPKSRPATPTRKEPGASYAQNLLSRFNLPSAREGLAAPAGDFYGLLSTALAQVASGSASREMQAEEISASGTLIPKGMTSAAEKMSFLETQRERLRVLLSALDKEASNLSVEQQVEKDVDRRLGVERAGEGMARSKSEADFEAIDREEAKKEEGGAGDGGSWMPWAWGAKQGEGKKQRDGGRATGVDAGA
ncbi:TB2/DP1/HVA22-related protein [Lasallia pustulata]|uniref:Protein YOP1 n=1 Tax=Lasallia pustulata TaxID=136370 RepID=A0A1W5CXT4_9LECA|nr:TB2/DP1/HVA22-related protein [Lasallia pustulata]